MVADYVRGIHSGDRSRTKLPPVTASLAGALKGRKLDRAQYRQHLEGKYR